MGEEGGGRKKEVKVLLKRSLFLTGQGALLGPPSSSSLRRSHLPTMAVTSSFLTLPFLNPPPPPPSVLTPSGQPSELSPTGLNRINTTKQQETKHKHFLNHLQKISDPSLKLQLYFLIEPHIFFFKKCSFIYLFTGNLFIINHHIHSCGY